MTEQALQTFKSDFAREIFKNDLYHTCQDMTAHRNELRRTGRDKIAEIVQQINNSAYENETVVTMLRKVSKTLENYKGKTVYGYMPKAVKNLINGVIDELANFIVMKTGTHPFVSKLKLFFKWGIEFDTEKYTVPDKGARKVSYSPFNTIIHLYPQFIIAIE